MRSLRVVVLASAVLGSSFAHGGPINPGFETGDLTGWTSSLSGGAATVVISNSTTYATAATYLPPEGARFLAIQSGWADQWQRVIQSLDVGAGGVVSGLAAFDWGDYLPYADGVRVRILDAAGAELAMPFYLDGAAAPGSGYNGPWTAWSWTAGAAGKYTVEYAARNTLDGTGPNQTFGYFDALQVGPPASLQASAVPEPGSLALLAAALFGLACARRRG